MQSSTKTETLIFWGVQYKAWNEIAYVFKRDRLTQDQLLIVFSDSRNFLHPNKGSKMKVSYCLMQDGSYHGSMLVPTDPGAFD